jgi:hypothetical protein
MAPALGHRLPASIAGHTNALLLPEVGAARDRHPQRCWLSTRLAAVEQTKRRFRVGRQAAMPPRATGYCIARQNRSRRVSMQTPRRRRYRSSRPSSSGRCVRRASSGALLMPLERSADRRGESAKQQSAARFEAAGPPTGITATLRGCAAAAPSKQPRPSTVASGIERKSRPRATNA